MKTAEYVSPKHPDKLCDQISDAILDACLEQDPNSRVAIETMGGHGIITITGELTTKAYINAREIAQRVAGSQYGVQTNIVSQSPEIAQGVDTGGAGDQGIMTGYACNENEAMIPQELYLARSLCEYIYEKYPFDGKTQITLEDNKISAIVVSFQNASGKEIDRLVANWLGTIPTPLKEKAKLYFNPAGDWQQGGFEADTGVTGRKLAIDNYGTRVAIGGGAFSGKDASKVDRSGAYMARYIAVDLLKKHNAKVVKTALAYAIGIAQPVMITATIVKENGDADELDITKDYDCTPSGIINLLELKKPQYETLARWGHFGRKTLWS